MRKFGTQQKVRVVSGPHSGRVGVVVGHRTAIIHHRWKTKGNFCTVHFGDNDQDEFREEELESA